MLQIFYFLFYGYVAYILQVWVTFKLSKIWKMEYKYTSDTKIEEINAYLSKQKKYWIKIEFDELLDIIINFNKHVIVLGINCSFVLKTYQILATFTPNAKMKSWGKRYRDWKLHF